MSNSEEEEIARDYICFGNPDVTIVIVDATCLERNLNLVFQVLEITPNVVVCVNLLDEAEKKGIDINLKKLSLYLGVPVVGTIARKSKTLNNLMNEVYNICINKPNITPKTITYNPIIEDCIRMLDCKLQNILPLSYSYISRWIALKLLDGNKKILEAIQNYLQISITENEQIISELENVTEILEKNDIDESNFRDKIVSRILFTSEDIYDDVCHLKDNNYSLRDRKIDKILTSKKWGIPIMLLFLGFIFWLTITGANYPSQVLSSFFGYIQEKLYVLFNALHAPSWLSGVLIDGMYQTLSWVVAVMLPPMAIFFPLFTLLEDLGVLPRISFNLDNYFRKACSSGKQALTMCMGVTKLDIFIISLIAFC